MEENNKKKRRAYLDDFKQTAQGDYEYKGNHYVWDGTKESLKKELIVLWIYAGVMIALIVAAGCLPVQSMINCVYVILPFTVCFICAVSVIWGLVRMTSGGATLRAYVYDATVEQIPLRAVGTMLGAAATIAGELVYLIRNGFEGKTAAIFFLIALAAAFVLLYFLRIRMQKMCWKRSI